MRVTQFVGPDELDPVELGDSVHLDLAEGADPGELIRILTEQVELPPEEAQEIVGQQNAKLQEMMHYVAERLERSDRTIDIIDGLVELNWPRTLAREFVARVQQELGHLARTDEGRGQLLAASRRRMLFGLAWFGGGIFVTWFTQYSAETRGGGYAVIAWGAILYGFALFCMGAYRWIRHKFG